MSLADANILAFHLALTLMVTVVVFRAGDGTMGVMTAAEYDGGEDTIVREVDPYAG